MIPRFNDDRDWFFEKRFGLFVHFGVYSVPGWHEQIQWRKNIPRSEYVKFAELFNPVKYDPDEWLDLAEATGMGYICLGSKHHDGFCLWDTKQTAFNVMNTPYKRDIIAMLAEACHRRGFPMELYYSCVDWNHPNYPNENRSHELPRPEPGDEPDFAKYMEFLKAQIRELCTNYGEIHGIWWDMNVVKHHDPSINDMIRSLQPKAVINDRGYDEGDYGTPERHVPDGRAFAERTEACQSLGIHSWGYKEDDDFYSDKLIMASIDKTLAMGGNYLLNVGPRPDGAIQPEFVRTLRHIGQWFGAVKESLMDAEPASHMTENASALLTRKGNTLYAHFPQTPDGTGVVLKPLDKMPKRVTLLNDGRALDARVDRGARMYYEPEYLRIRNLPVNEMQDTVMVVKMEFDELPNV